MGDILPGKATNLVCNLNNKSDFRPTYHGSQIFCGQPEDKVSDGMFLSSASFKVSSNGCLLPAVGMFFDLQQGKCI